MKVLLFDVDGTLLRAGGAGRKALSRAVRALYGAPVDCLRMDLAGSTDLGILRDLVSQASGRKATRREVERLKSEYLRRLPRLVRAALRSGSYELTPGIRRLLSRLGREEELLIGLGTGNLREGARIKLEPSGLGRFFRFGGYGCDATERSAILKKAVARAQGLLGRTVRKTDVYVIGDTPKDVAAGRRAGYKTIAVGTGFSTWEALKASKPDHLARDFQDTEAWLRWLKIGNKLRKPS
ncbi:MAG: HAD hydrolase-like protein [Elusimicrobiota bacterium]